jgi:hypothetical protein
MPVYEEGRAEPLLERVSVVHCPACSVLPILTNTIRDPQYGRTVRLYECQQCGARIWDD